MNSLNFLSSANFFSVSKIFFCIYSSSIVFKDPFNSTIGLPKPAVSPSATISFGWPVLAFLSAVESFASRGADSSWKETPLWKRWSLDVFKLLYLPSGEPKPAPHFVFTVSSLNREVGSESSSCEFFIFQEPSDCWALARKLILTPPSSSFEKTLVDGILIKFFLFSTATWSIRSLLCFFWLSRLALDRYLACSYNRPEPNAEARM